MISYLSGAMEYAKNDGADWREEITPWLIENLNHSVIDPVVESKKLIKNYKEVEFRSWKQTDPKKYIDIIRIAISQITRILMIIISIHNFSDFRISVRRVVDIFLLENFK